MFTGKVLTDGSRLLLSQESNLADKQPRRAPQHVIQATMSEGLAQGPNVAAIELDSIQRPSAPKAPNTIAQPPGPFSTDKLIAVRNLWCNS